jgi:hypothetical protein
MDRTENYHDHNAPHWISADTLIHGSGYEPSEFMLEGSLEQFRLNGTGKVALHNYIGDNFPNFESAFNILRELLEKDETRCFKMDSAINTTIFWESDTNEFKIFVAIEKSQTIIELAIDTFYLDGSEENSGLLIFRGICTDTAIGFTNRGEFVALS